MKISSLLIFILTATVVLPSCSLFFSPDFVNKTGMNSSSSPSSNAPAVYTVTYYPNGASVGTVPAGGTYTSGQKVTVASNAGLTCSGFTFAGWTTSTNGPGTSYDASGTNTFLMPSANISFYAVWISTGFNFVSSGTSITLTSCLSASGPLVIPAGVTAIGDNACNGCSSITSVSIPDSLISIGFQSFQGCSGLKSFTIPNSLTSIGSYAFNNCGLTNLIIPGNVRSIGSQAFYQCGFLSNLIISNGVTNIGDRAFLVCGSLTSINIPNSVLSIGNQAFSSCGGITNVIFGSNILSIGDNAFDSSTKISNLTIPASVTNIGSGAFSGCGLTNANILATKPPTLGLGAFGGGGFPIFVPAGCLTAYQNASDWYGSYGEWLTNR